MYVKEHNYGRESTIRSLHNAGIEVTEIIDVTHYHTMDHQPQKKKNLILFLLSTEYYSYRTIRKL